jgi:hypothetical protein
MAVRDRDPLQVARLAPELSDRSEDTAAVVLKQRVDQGQLAGVVEQEGVHAAALGVAEAVDARRELSHETAERCQGANGLATRWSAGSSSGKWRSSSVRIEFASTQSMPCLV